MISRDPNAVTPGTPAYLRMAEYRAQVEDLTVVASLSGFVRAFVSRRAFDLVTSQDPFETGVFAYLIAKRFGARLELQIHTDFLSPYYGQESLKNRVRVWIAKLLLPKAHCVRVVSSRIKRSLMALGVSERNVVVLPIWVDTERFATPASPIALRIKYPQFKTIALMISRLAREKNIARAIRAFALVVKENPDAGLVIVGDGPMKNELFALVQKLGILKSVVFEPWTADAPSYFASADFFISVSRYEGYGLTLAESALAGCPIASTDVGLVGDILLISDIKVLPDDGDEALAEALGAFLRDQKLRDALRQSARARVANLPTRKEYLENMKRAWLSCGS